MKPRWVTKRAVLAIHEMLIAEHGGPSGLKNEGALDSALASPLNLLAYETPDVFDLAAKYPAWLTRNHPFNDGNKRVAFTVAGVFLELNGYTLTTDQADAVHAVQGLTVGILSENDFAKWLRDNCRKPPAKTAKSRKSKAKLPRKKPR